MNPVDLANTKASIHDVFRFLELESTPNYTGKIHCPFGEIYHSDGGADPAMRVYSDTNSAYCFRCSASYSPVWLYAQVKGCRSREAAMELLELIGYKPPTAMELWEKFNNPDPVAPDVASLAVALKTYCSRMAEDWKAQQFHPQVADKLSKCLALLDYVQTEEQAEKWLTTTKKVMRKVLEAASGVRVSGNVPE